MTVIARSIAPLFIVLWLTAACGGPGASGPAPSPRITCVGIPPEKCAEAVASVERALPNEHPVAIDVTCVSGACTSDGGAMDTVVTLAGGRQLHASPLSWGNPKAPGGIGVPPDQPGVPPLPVAPVCLAMPPAMCQQMAGSDLSDAANHGGVVKIVVSCTKVPCTDTTGEGDTTYTFGDGTTRSVGWGYMSAS